MANEQDRRGTNAHQSKDTKTAKPERAISDGEFRARPLWRAVQRPDRAWAAELTVGGQVALREATHADSNP